MNYFPNLAQENSNIQELVSTLKEQKRTTLDDTDAPAITNVIEMLEGTAKPKEFDKYFLLDSFETLDALFIFNGLIPAKDSGLGGLIDYCHRITNAHKQEQTPLLSDSERIQMGIDECAVDLRADYVDPLIISGQLVPATKIIRMDGLSTWSFHTLPEKIFSSRPDIKLSFYEAVLNDLRPRLMNIQKQLTIWQSGDHSEKPSLDYVREWAELKEFDPNFSLVIDGNPIKHRSNTQNEVIKIYLDFFKKDKKRNINNSAELFAFMRGKAREGAQDLSIQGLKNNEISIDSKVIDKDAFRKRIERNFGY